jgi:NADH-quinone oxidoreductase subunit N
MSVIGAFYYLRVVWLMYFDAPGDRPRGEPRLSLRFVVGVNAVAALALGLMPDALLDVCLKVVRPG